jgi:hypothetical protein
MGLEMCEDRCPAECSEEVTGNQMGISARDGKCMSNVGRNP